jgi:hypothetical protein
MVALTHGAWSKRGARRSVRGESAMTIKDVGSC